MPVEGRSGVSGTAFSFLRIDKAAPGRTKGVTRLADTPCVCSLRLSFLFVCCKEREKNEKKKDEYQDAGAYSAHFCETPLVTQQNEPKTKEEEGKRSVEGDP